MKTNKEFIERSKEALGEGVQYAFCPNHLNLEGREDLWVFPHNILFMKYRGEPDGSVTAGTALYNPDISSLVQDKDEWEMTYRNQYGGDGYVVIKHNIKNQSYQGDKFVNGIWVGSATGRINDNESETENGWHLFFFHLTMLGLSNGERCFFRKIEKDDSVADDSEDDVESEVVFIPKKPR